MFEESEWLWNSSHCGNGTWSLSPSWICRITLGPEELEEDKSITEFLASFSLTTLVPSLHFLLCPFIFSASVYFWQIWQKYSGLGEPSCSLPTLMPLLQIASEPPPPGLGQSVGISFVSALPVSALWAGCPAEPVGQPQAYPPGTQVERLRGFREKIQN